MLLLGSLGARQPGHAKWAFAGSAAVASVLWFSVLWFSALGYGARWLAPEFARPRAWQVLDVLIGLVMLALAAGLG